MGGACLTSSAAGQRSTKGPLNSWKVNSCAPLCSLGTVALIIPMPKDGRLQQVLQALFGGLCALDIPCKNSSVVLLPSRMVRAGLVTL